MAPIAIKLWHSLIARHATSITKAIQKGLKAFESRAALETIPIRNVPKQPLHPLARIRQSQSRWYSTARDSLSRNVRNFSSFAYESAPRHQRGSFPKSATGSHIRSSSHRAPFASTLRPNLTGGTLGRTAGGYSLGSGKVGGARYFSHGPASQAQVVHNVSQGIRAFFTSGHRAQFDGVSPQGHKRFKAVKESQQEKYRKLRELPRATPGSYIEFAVNPTITALASFDSVSGYASSRQECNHLNSNGLIDALSVDFSRSLKDLAAVLNDLGRLSKLGDLPITYESSRLKVHFAGCDANFVEGLCEELGVQRGVVVQDEAFDAFAGAEIALLFPFAPTKEHSPFDGSDCDDPCEVAGRTLMAPQRHLIDVCDMLSETSAYSTQSDPGNDEQPSDNDLSWQTLEYDSLSNRSRDARCSEQQDPLEYRVEGIYEFLKILDDLGR